MPSILLVKTSSLGDVIHNLPVVSDISAKFPDMKIDWAVEESFAAIPRLHPAVRRVFPVALRRWRSSLMSRVTWGELRKFKHDLQSEHYDHVLDTQGLIKSALITRLARGQRCGYAAEAAREPLAARCYDVTFTIPKNLHAVERNRWLAAAALGYILDTPLDYGIRATPLQADWLPAAPYVVLLTATSRADKLWPEPYWLTLAAELNARGLYCVLPAGSEIERKRVAKLAGAMKRAVVAPPMQLDTLAALLAGAQAVIGVDTGLTHLAAALQVPVAALFCGSDPQLTGVHAGVNAINLGGIGEEPKPVAVLAAIESWLPR